MLGRDARNGSDGGPQLVKSGGPELTKSGGPNQTKSCIGVRLRFVLRIIGTLGIHVIEPRR